MYVMKIVGNIRGLPGLFVGKSPSSVSVNSTLNFHISRYSWCIRCCIKVYYMIHNRQFDYPNALPPCSSLSVVLNSTAAVLLEDIFKGCFNWTPSDKVAGLIVKGSILILGALAMIFLLVVEKLGGILGVCFETQLMFLKTSKFFLINPLVRSQLVCQRYVSFSLLEARKNDFTNFTFRLLRAQHLVYLH